MGRSALGGTPIVPCPARHTKRLPVHITEYADTKPRKTPIWFAISRERPLAAFAGIWRPWNGVRGTKAEPVEGEHLHYSLLTTEPNSVVAPIHPKAMPVILTTPEEYEIWLHAPVEKALTLQRPLPDDMLEIVSEGQRSDPPAEGDRFYTQSA